MFVLQMAWYHKNSSQAISISETIVINNNPVMGGLRKFEVRVRKDGDRQTFMLIIRRLRQQDAGHYECKLRVVGVDYGKCKQKIGTLTVQGM